MGGWDKDNTWNCKLSITACSNDAVFDNSLLLPNNTQYPNGVSFCKFVSCFYFDFVVVQKILASLACGTILLGSNNAEKNLDEFMGIF